MKIGKPSMLHQLAKTYGWVGPKGAAADASSLLGEDLSTDETDTSLVLHPDGSGGTAWGTDATGVIVEDEGTPLATTADTLNFVGAGVTATGAGGTKTITIPSGGGGTGTPGWFNVKDAAYGAVGDGSTDDTAAINLAIAALIAAGKGVLYFPAGTYKATGALTTLSVPCLVLGDGSASYDDAVSVSQVNCTSQTAVLFTVSAKMARFEKIALVNTYGGTPSAGSAVLVDSAYLEQRVDFEGCSFQGFYDNVDVKVGAQWSYHACFNIAPVRYGIRIRNTVNNDAGDWAISDCDFSAQTYNSTAAVQIESAGGGKVTNTKINMALDSKRFGAGINLAFAAGASSSILLVANCSIENVSGDAIKVATSSTGTFSSIAVENVQVGLYSNNTGYAVNINAGTAGGGVGGIQGVIVSGLIAKTDGTARNAISLVNVDTVRIGHVVLVGFNSAFATSGATNVIDDTGSVAANVAISGTPTSGYVPIATSATSATWQTAPGGGVTGFATPAIVLGSVAAAGAATTVIRSDATVVAFDATAPTTQALGDAAATGSAAVAARRDHKHAMPALSTATPLVESGSGSAGTAAPSSREDHVHPAAAASSPNDHIHIVGEALTGDGATTAFLLNNEAIPGTVAVYNVAGARVAPPTLGGANDLITLAAQPGTGTFYVDYIPVQA